MVTWKVNYRTANEELEAVKKEIEACQVACLPVQGDVSKFEDTEKMAKEIIDTWGRIDVLVNNAGATALTKMLRLATSLARLLVNPMIPALEAL